MVTIMVITPLSLLCMQDSEVFGASAPYVISGNKVLTFLERLKDGLVRVMAEGWRHNMGEGTAAERAQMLGGGREAAVQGGEHMGGWLRSKWHWGRQAVHLDLILPPPLPRFGGLHKTPVRGPPSGCNSLRRTR